MSGLICTIASVNYKHKDAFEYFLDIVFLKIKQQQENTRAQSPLFTLV